MHTRRRHVSRPIPIRGGHRLGELHRGSRCRPNHGPVSGRGRIVRWWRCRNGPCSGPLRKAAARRRLGTTTQRAASWRESHVVPASRRSARSPHVGAVGVAEVPLNNVHSHVARANGPHDRRSASDCPFRIHRRHFGSRNHLAQRGSNRRHARQSTDDHQVVDVRPRDARIDDYLFAQASKPIDKRSRQRVELRSGQPTVREAVAPDQLRGKRQTHERLRCVSQLDAGGFAFPCNDLEQRRVEPVQRRRTRDLAKKRVGQVEVQTPAAKGNVRSACGHQDPARREAHDRRFDFARTGVHDQRRTARYIVHDRKRQGGRGGWRERPQQVRSYAKCCRLQFRSDGFTQAARTTGA